MSAPPDIDQQTEHHGDGSIRIGPRCVCEVWRAKSAGAVNDAGRTPIFWRAVDILRSMLNVPTGEVRSHGRPDDRCRNDNLPCLVVDSAIAADLWWTFGKTAG